MRPQSLRVLVLYLHEIRDVIGAGGRRGDARNIQIARLDGLPRRNVHASAAGPQR